VRRWRIGIVVAVAIVVAAFVWLRSEPGITPQQQDNETPPVASSESVPRSRPTERPAPAVESERAAAEDAPREDWNQRYLVTDDFFAFVQAAAPAAIAGDGRAQYLISRALLWCRVELIAEQQPRLPYASPNPRRLCTRFHEGHPLDAFGLAEEAKSFVYWRETALAHGDALAVVADAITTFGKYGVERDPAAKEQLRQKVLAGIRVVVESRDPEAVMDLATFAQFDSSAPTAREPWRFASWLVAACELGLDCSKPPPTLIRECATSQRCEATTTVADMIQMVGYPNDVYVAGQDIAYKIKTGDWEGLQPHLPLRD